MDARFPDPAGFLAGEIEVDTAAIPSMQALGPDARRKLVAGLDRRWRPASPTSPARARS